MKLIFIDSPESEKISYDIATVTSDRDVVIITAIRYNSSNFMNQPYILTMSKKTYKIKKDEPVKSSLEKFVDDAIAINKKDVANRLYITNKELYGLVVEKDPKS
ncbi:hypothetical protein NDN13_01490 [Acinetobacter sp. C32I]|uniref:hypothetical protein n=1 Tax=Acinetobacter sp. C32I TaxID=2950074 RepID=UPI0020374FA6|nr:hypothetical protein [Acinetobacter sp. C32I]USA53894.1 hypothetical protein NDN13_01490 [Acinetobacter sp. C32I]